MKLSKKLIDNAPWFITLEVAIVLVAIFMPMFTLDLSSLGEASINVSLWDIITNAEAVVELGLPWVFLIGLVGMSTFTTFFGKAKKSDVDSAMPYLIISTIGTLIMIIFVVFLSQAWLLNGMGFPANTHADLKEFFKIGIGSWITLTLSMAATGLVIYTYTQEK